jgi:SprB repeat
MNRKLLLSILFLAFCIQSAHSTILYVNANVQGGNQDGTSWANAFPLLQSAIIEAQYGDTIWVAQGTYTPTTGINRNISFTLKNGVRFIGGFTGTETALDERDWETNETILSGDIGMPWDSTDNSYTVVYCNFADSTTVLDGFVITGGNADNSATSAPPSSRTKSGGGLYLEGSSTLEDVRPWLVNCRFTGNTAVSNGGGVYMRSTGAGSCSPNFEDCIFENNDAFYGGGMYKEGGSQLNDMEVTGCRFESNSALWYGGGLGYSSTNGNKKLSVIECEFILNSSVFAGGAFYIDNFTAINRVMIQRCKFRENGSGSGSAYADNNWVYNENVEMDSCLFDFNNVLEGTVTFFEESKTVISNCSFNANSNEGTYMVILGGGNLVVENCIFSKSNSTITPGLMSHGGGSTKLVNSIIYKNDGTGDYLIDHNSGELDIKNSVITGNNLAPSGYLVDLDDGATLTISNTLLDIPDCSSIANLAITSGTVICGPGNLYNADPMFLDTAAHDFRLHPCSPARDAGDNAIIDSLGILTDIAGAPRIQGGTVDMGAYESPAFAIVVDTVTAAPCATATGSVSLGLGTGCPPFFLEWNGPGGTTGGTISDTSFVLLEVPPGSYTITVTDGRMDSDTILVMVEAPPLLTATTTATAIACPGGPGGTAGIAAAGGTPPYAYLWSNADTTATLENLPAGTYAVTVTDANGCTLTDSVTVETTGHLTLSINVTPTNCHDSNDGTAAITPLGGTAPFAWLWQDDQTDSLLTGLGGGSWSVTVTDALGCTGDVQFSMTAPDTLVAEVTGTGASCFGEATGEAAATATGGTEPYSYQWSNAMTTPVIGQLPPGWYSVTVTGLNQCNDTASVFIASPPALDVAVEATQRLCFGENDGTAAALASGGTPPYSFEWETGQTDSLLTGLPPGSYAVTVTDGNGCTGEATAVIDSSAQIQALFEITHATGAANADGGVEVSLVFGGTPGYEFLWSNGAVTQSLENVLPGPYSLTVTDADSCQNVFYFTVDVENAAGEEQAVPFRAVIVPNPSRAGGAELWLEATQPQVLTVQVLDGLGRVLFSKEAFVQMGETRWNLPQGLPPGVYWVAVRNGDGATKVLKWMVV